MTPRQLKTAVPFIKDAQMWTDILNDILPKYEIDTPIRIASFLAQTGHESMDFRYLSENLNYDSIGLAKTWPKRYAELDVKGNVRYPITPNAKAMSISRMPEKIANHCYAGRMGNGDEDSGDGWKYRGKGLIQITGYTNHKCFADAVSMTVDEATEYMLTPRGAVESACWFWKSRGLNDVADKMDLEGMTREINGGVIGLADRKSRLLTAKVVFGVL